MGNMTIMAELLEAASNIASDEQITEITIISNRTATAPNDSEKVTATTIRLAFGPALIHFVRRDWRGIVWFRDGIKYADLEELIAEGLDDYYYAVLHHKN